MLSVHEVKAPRLALVFLNTAARRDRVLTVVTRLCLTQVVLRAGDDAVRPHLLQELLGALLGPHTPVSPLQGELEAGERDFTQR